MTDKLKLSPEYTDLVTKLHDQVNIDTLVGKYKANLEKMRDAVIEFGNALSVYLNSGEFTKVEGSVNWDGSEVMFDITTKLGHEIWVEINSSTDHYFSVSVKGDGHRAISFYKSDIADLIKLMSSYNYLQVTTESDYVIYDTWIDPEAAPESSGNPRENE